MKAEPSIETRTSAPPAPAADDRFRRLVESVTGYAIFLLDRAGIIQSWNEGARQIKGYEADEIIGRHFSIFYTSEDNARGHPDHELEIAVREGRYEEEGWRVKRDGTRFWAYVVITALRGDDGKVIGFAKVTRDLTDRRRTEEALRQSEERNRLMFESMKDYSMFMISPEGIIQSWNEGVRRIKGYEMQEVIGQHFSIFYPEEDVRMGRCEFEMKEAAVTGRFEDEGWRKRKDGTLFWANVVLTAVRDKNGKLLGFSKVTRDMTDRRQAEEKLKLALDHMERRVAERTHELSESNQRLKEAVQIRDEFLSIASHELRTPLTPLKLQIQGLVHQMKAQGVDRLPPDRILKAAQSCEKSIARLSSLIDSLLDVSRLNSGKFQIAVEQIDLVPLVEEIAERYRNESANMGTVIFLVAPRSLTGYFDPLRIEQVVANLISNALKYGRGRPIHFTLEERGESVLFQVRDEGIGISMQDQARIFERYERVDTGGNVGGLGLGLYITRQIVQAHGGTIRVESTEGKGSVFTVEIPLHRELPN